MKISSRHRKVGPIRVEVGTVEHAGRRYEAFGSVVDHASGIVTGYPKGNALVTFDGKTTGTCRVVSRRKNPRGLLSNEVVCYRCTVDSIPYHGRGGGDGMALHLRRIRGRR